jgi:ABC-2 type transport system ATP-binding protein
VDDVSFELAPGEIFALLGPNGAGKTTTLRMLAGLIAPTSGTVRIGGETLSAQNAPRLRSRIGFLTETPGLWERLDVRLNLLVYARLHGLPTPERAVDEAMDAFDIRDRARDTAAQLSKGLRQRVALARTLLHRPDVILLDEPTAGLDPESAREVRELVLRLRNEHRTVLISTHNLDEVERIAGRVAILRSRLVAVDTPAALRARLFGSRVRVVLVQPAEPLVRSLIDAGFGDITADGLTLSVGVNDPASTRPDRPAPRGGGADVQSVAAEQPPLNRSICVCSKSHDSRVRSARQGTGGPSAEPGRLHAGRPHRVLFDPAAVLRGDHRAASRRRAVGGLSDFGSRWKCTQPAVDARSIRKARSRPGFFSSSSFSCLTPVAGRCRWRPTASSAKAGANARAAACDAAHHV